MKKLSIGDNIRKLRKEKNITQEQLADLLSVSYQAVSKWENNIGYPDITLLPTLANALDTSIDTIMGTDKSKALLEETFREIGEKTLDGRLREAYEIGKNTLEQFPTNDVLLITVSSLTPVLYPTATDKEKDTLIEEVRSMTDRILEYSHSDELKIRAKWNLCHAYLTANDKQSAFQTALGLPDLSTCRQYVLPNCMEGEESMEYIAKTMYLATTMFLGFVGRSAPVVSSEKTITEQKTLYKLGRKITEDFISVWDIAFSLMPDGLRIKRQNVEYLHLHISSAVYAAEESDLIAGIAHLCEAAICASNIDKAENLPIEVAASNGAIKQLLHKHIGFRLTQAEVISHNLSYALLNGLLPSSVFDGIRNTVEFTEVAQMLEKTAE